MCKHDVYELVPAPKGRKILAQQVGISKAKAFLMTTFATKDLACFSLFLGMQVSRDRVEGTLDTLQGDYVNATLERYGFVDSRWVGTHGTGNPWA